MPGNCLEYIQKSRIMYRNYVKAESAGDDEITFCFLVERRIETIIMTPYLRKFAIYTCAPITTIAIMVTASGHRLPPPPHVHLVCQTCGGRTFMKKQEKEVVRTLGRSVRAVHRALVRSNRPEFPSEM